MHRMRDVITIITYNHPVSNSISSLCSHWDYEDANADSTSREKVVDEDTLLSTHEIVQLYRTGTTTLTFP